MAPKHRLGAAHHEDPSAKRARGSETPASRSATPADSNGKIAFKVYYPPVGTTRKLSNKEKQLVAKAERQVSPFIARGASKPGELDQFYTVEPSKNWAEMKKYNNFISTQL